MHEEPERKEREELPQSSGSEPRLEKRQGGWRQYAIECNRLYVLGCLVMIGGLLLWLGNLTKILPTFRGAGFVVIALGCALWHLGIFFPRRRKL